MNLKIVVGLRLTSKMQIVGTVAMVRPLWAHQEEAIRRATKLNGYGLFFEMGAGKTRTVLEILKEKNKQERKTLRTLIFAPSVVTFNWKKEIVQFMPEINPAHVLVLHGTGLQRTKQLEQTPNYFIVVANYEATLMPTVFRGLKDWEPEVVIADESQRIKSHKAQRTKQVIGLSTFAKYKYILSGTPVTNNEADLFSQFLFLDNGETFGKSFFTFRNHWFTDANRKLRQISKAVTWPKWEPKKQKAEDFKRLVMSKAMSVLKSECMDLPPYTQTTIEVEMSDEQKRAYKQMKDDYITFIKSAAFTAELAVTKALRLNQITSGFLMNTEGKTHVFKDTPKDKALLELIEEASGKLVVWSCWKESQRHLRELFQKNKIEHRELLGDSTAEQRDQALVDFADDPKVKVMLASQAAGGIGISLVSANTAIYYSRNFSYEADAQSAARIHRGGAERHQNVYRIDLVVPNTIDVSCLESLARKEELKDAIINSRLQV